MRAPYEAHPVTWRGVALEVRYCPDWSPGYAGRFGYALAHLEIDAHGQPLPVTETGYRSHFERADTITAHGGPVAFVRALLDEAATAKRWQDAAAQARQLTLF